MRDLFNHWFGTVSSGTLDKVHGWSATLFGGLAVAFTREQVTFWIGVFCAVPAIYSSCAFIVSKAARGVAWCRGLRR